MKDLSVLTPPFLMAAAVIFAIGAFLRHETRRGRRGRADPEDTISSRQSGDGVDTKQSDEAETSPNSATDS